MQYDSDMMKVIICKKCKGLGFCDGMSGPFTCSECKGAGRVVEKTNKEEYPMSIFEWPELNQQPLFPNFADGPDEDENEGDIEFENDEPYFPQLGMPALDSVEVVDVEPSTDTEEDFDDDEKI